MSFNQRIILLNTFTKFQFGCCPQIWMFHSRRVNHKINHYMNVHIVQIASANIHEKNIQSLSIKLFKVNRIFSNVIRCNIFKTRTLTYNSWSEPDFETDCVNAQRCRLNSLSYFTPKFWDVVLLEMKNVNYLQKLKTQIRKCAPENCSCYICQPYIQNLVFLDLVYIFELFI